MGDSPTLQHASTPVATQSGFRTTLVIEAMLSFAANLLFIGIFFYTTKVFGWDLVRNFFLASVQGAVYIVGSLASQLLSKRLGGRRLLIVANVALGVASLVGMLSADVRVLIAVIVIYVPLMALNWPVLESAASANADPHTLSKRIGLYNIVWAGTGALAVAIQGTLLRIDPRTVFLVPLVVHVVIVGIIVFRRGYGVTAAVVDAAEVTAAPHLEPEPALLRQRSLALALSRIALPSTYVVIYSLSALMPSLPVMQRLDPVAQTVVGSAWMASRWVAFYALGATVFWHTRPRLLLAAAVLMGLAFVGVAAPLGLGAMIVAQVVLGGALGLIYTASLYFGMVLSDGSAEHAGYHEALIGVGQVVGPGAGALTQMRWPNNLFAGVVAVSSLIFISICAAAMAGLKARRRSDSV